MIREKHTLILSALCFTLASACASTEYRPRQSERAALTVNSEQYEIVRAGKVYRVGPYWGGVDVAFPEGVPGHEYAVKAERASDIGAVGVLAGLGMTIAASFMFSSSGGGLGTSSEEREDILTLNLGGLAMLIFGASFLSQARVHTLDAINRHNDEIGRRE